MYIRQAQGSQRHQSGNEMAKSLFISRNRLNLIIDKDIVVTTTIMCYTYYND